MKTPPRLSCQGASPAPRLSPPPRRAWLASLLLVAAPMPAWAAPAPWVSSDAASASDLDGDGLGNEQEEGLGTDPLVADSDGGGVNDGAEVFIDGTNPLDPVDDDPRGPKLLCTRDAFIGLGVATQLTRVDASVDPFVLSPVGAPAAVQYNALGYNPFDGYLYGWNYTSKNELVRVDGDGGVTVVGKPVHETTGATIAKLSFNAGDLDLSGNLWTVISGQTRLFRINTQVTPPTWAEITLSQPVTCFDLGISPRNGRGYCVNHEDATLEEIDLTTGLVTARPLVGSLAGDLAFGASWFDPQGRLWAYRNSGHLLRIDVSTGATELLGVGPSSSNNDGASCALGAQFEKSVSPNPVIQGDDATFTFSLNHSGIDLDGDGVYDPLTGLEVDDTPSYDGAWLAGSVEYSTNGAAWSATPPSGVTATVSGLGGPRLRITNITLPASDTNGRGYTLFIRAVHRMATDVEPGTQTNQASLTGLPSLFGGAIVSDNPLTLAPGDATTVTVSQAADSDDDGLNDPAEARAGTDPTDADSDDDGLSDAEEIGGRDGDPSTDDGSEPMDVDSDDDGIPDAAEGDGSYLGQDFAPTDPLDADSDDDGLPDGVEIGATTALPGGQSAGGLSYQGTNPAVFGAGDQDPTTTTDPRDDDTDTDGLLDGAEDANQSGAVDPTETDPTNGDTDGGGVGDGAEVQNGTDPLDPTDDTSSPDSDGDGLSNEAEATLGLDAHDPDTDNDKLTDLYEVTWVDPTAAGDGDAAFLPLNPLDADSDDDGISDGDEERALGPLLGLAPTHPVRADTDLDGVPDGVELAVTTNVAGGLSDGEAVPYLGTDLDLWRADADPATVSDPNDTDTDDDGLPDGAEDTNHDGARLDPETDPADADTDDGGVDDGDEVTAGTDPLDPSDDGASDPDSDGDGLTDAEELALGTGPNDPDSDNDGLEDGAEVNTYTTDPLDADTDDDTLTDGAEVNTLGTDPTNTDTDDDDLDDGDEVGLGTDPLDSDSDEDGIGDGAELDAGSNPRAPDSDYDGLPDGLELGVTSPDAGTDLGAGVYVADTDPDTTTDPEDADTDNDGLDDGEEDADANGAVSTGETDPNNADTDGGGINDGDEVSAGTDPLDPEDDAVLHVRGGSFLGCDASGGAGGGAGWAGLLTLGLAAALRRRHRRAAALAAVIAAGGAGGAAAQEAHFDVQQLQPTTSASAGYIGVVSAAGVSPRQLHAGAFFQLANDVLVVEDQDGERIGALVARQGTLNLSATYGLSRRFDVGLDVPIVLGQAGDDIALLPEASAADPGGGLGDVRIVPRVVVWDGSRRVGPWVAVALVGDVFLPTGDATVYQGEGAARFQGRVAADLGLGTRSRFSVNLGYLARPTSTLLDVEVDDAFVWGLAARVPVRSRVALVPELAGQVYTQALDRGVEELPMELRLAAHIGMRRVRTLTVGAGMGLVQGFGSPDWRLYAGYARSPDKGADRDGDGLVDGDDRCPALPEDTDTWQDEDGCPDLDNDGDGVLDRDDGAPDQPEDIDGFQDMDGIPERDNDGDGVLDVRDVCPAATEDPDAWEDEDGCPETDNDKDGIPDLDDGAPNDAEDFDGFEDTDGIPDPDNDRDGVRDPSDKCPLQPENRNGVEDTDGCPDQGGLLRVDCGEIQLFQQVHFQSGSDVILPQSYPLLKHLAEAINATERIKKIRIEGHTDNRGNDAANLQLSQRRAEAVRRWLILNGGVPEAVLVAEGYGETRPKVKNDTPAHLAQNRRVELIVVESEPCP